MSLLNRFLNFPGFSKSQLSRFLHEFLCLFNISSDSKNSFDRIYHRYPLIKNLTIMHWVLLQLEIDISDFSLNRSHNQHL